jgi:hypothetical protein
MFSWNAKDNSCQMYLWSKDRFKRLQGRMGPSQSVTHTTVQTMKEACEEEEDEDPWMKSRFDWIDVVDVSHTRNRWAR